jgi:hypothetical protein
MSGAETYTVDPAVNLRRSLIVSAALALVSIAVLAPFGHPLGGMFACIGVGLGALNNRMLQASVVTYAATPGMRKSQFSRRVLARLGIVTALAFALGLLIRPDGLGLFAGLAVFQIVMLVGASLPVLRSLRQP